MAVIDFINNSLDLIVLENLFQFIVLSLWDKWVSKKLNKPCIEIQSHTVYNSGHSEWLDEMRLKTQIDIRRRQRRKWNVILADFSSDINFKLLLWLWPSSQKPSLNFLFQSADILRSSISWWTLALLARDWYIDYHSLKGRDVLRWEKKLR